MIRNLLLLGGLGLVGYGGYQYFRTQSALLQNTDIDFIGLNLLERSTTRVRIRFNVRITNKSDQSFVISKYNFRVSINNRYVGDVLNSKADTLIKSGGQPTYMSMDFIVNPQEVGIGNVLLDALSTGGTSTINIFGTLTAKKGFISVNAPINLNYRLRELL